jgi:hypothetical protein
MRESGRARKMGQGKWRKRGGLGPAAKKGKGPRELCEIEILFHIFLI